MQLLRPAERTALFGKPYWWTLAADGQLALRPDIPIRTQPPLTNPTMRDFIQAAQRRLQ